jgi:hypothetical protein
VIVAIERQFSAINDHRRASGSTMKLTSSSQGLGAAPLPDRNHRGLKFPATPDRLEFLDRGPQMGAGGVFASLILLLIDSGDLIWGHLIAFSTSQSIRIGEPDVGDR